MRCPTSVAFIAPMECQNCRAESKMRHQGRLPLEAGATFSAGMVPSGINQYSRTFGSIPRHWTQVCCSNPLTAESFSQGPLPLGCVLSPQTTSSQSNMKESLLFAALIAAAVRQLQSSTHPKLEISMKIPGTLKLIKAAAAGLLGLLAANAYAQIGSGWTSISETFKIQTSGSGSVNGDTFSLTSTSSGTKDRAEREYNAWSSGTHQFQGDVTVVSLGGDRICLKQTFQENTGPWNMIAVQKSGHPYEVEGGN